MIKIFEGKEEQEGKINFIDNYNVLLGYDMESNCCEKFGWFISETVIDENVCEQDNKEFNLDDYWFDKDYLNKFTPEEFEAGCVAVFKMMSSDIDKPDLFLHLFNHHNGYYTHGFDFKDDNRGETLAEGYC